MKFPFAPNSCIWPRALPRCRPCRGSAWAQAYPARPVAHYRWLSHLVGGADIQARGIRPRGRLSGLVRRVMVENKPGAVYKHRHSGRYQFAHLTDTHWFLFPLRTRSMQRSMKKLAFNFLG